MLQVDEILRNSELSQLQIRRVFRQISYAEVPAGNECLHANECLMFWVIVLVWRLKFLSPDQQQYLLDAMLEQLGDVGAELELNPRPHHPPMLLIGDGRFATWHRHTGYLDLQSGESIESPPQPILESTAYNLAVLYSRNKAICQKGRQ